MHALYRSSKRTFHLTWWVYYSQERKETRRYSSSLSCLFYQALTNVFSSFFFCVCVCRRRGAAFTSFGTCCHWKRQLSMKSAKPKTFTSFVAMVQCGYSRHLVWYRRWVCSDLSGQCMCMMLPRRRIQSLRGRTRFLSWRVKEIRTIMRKVAGGIYFDVSSPATRWKS